VQGKLPAPLPAQPDPGGGALVVRIALKLRKFPSHELYPTACGVTSVTECEISVLLVAEILVLSTTKGS